MDFETRQKQAIEEINVILTKFGLSLQAYLNVQINGIIPGVRLIDVTKTEETKQEDVKTKKTKKGKK